MTLTNREKLIVKLFKRNLDTYFSDLIETCITGEGLDADTDIIEQLLIRAL